MAGDSSRVEIGYLEKTEPWKLESRFFPSKVGGKPAWLDLRNIDADVKCGRCTKPCIFLCQLYAPLTDREDTYHRTIYVFVCQNPECSKTNDNGNFVVYRCQLRQENEYYPVEEPEEREDWHPDAKTESYGKTCVVCGCFAGNQCGKCRTTKYCSRDHQILDWKCGHNKRCGSCDLGSADILFPEYEIVNESEIIDEEDENMLKDGGEKSEEEKMKEYENYVSKFKDGTLGNVDPKIMEELAFRKDDKIFRKFKDRLKICPDQVIRYDKGGTPLWISKPKYTNDDIPNCELCGSPREFEFQILPTLLGFLNVDTLEKSIDWGCLFVYTCVKNCDGSPSYKREYLYKQDADQ